MKRKYEFSIDSFQILLDSLLGFQGCQQQAGGAATSMTSTFYPSVEAVTMYGDFAEARHHLHHKLIGTRKPEEIRGGGLLKYCSLLLREYERVDDEVVAMEKYMCSRFFIDFKDIPAQRRTLEGYLSSHSLTQPEKRYNYLMILYRVVECSTVCLMSHERRITLRMILDLANQVFVQPQYQQHQLVYYHLPPPQQYVHQNHQHSQMHSSQNLERYYVPAQPWKSPVAAVTAAAETSSKLVQCH